MKNYRGGYALLAGASWLAFASIAQAQTAAPAASVDEVVVTGSRTIKNGNASPSPVTIVQADDVLQLKPGNLADALNVLPVFAGSRGASSNPSSTGTAAGGNGNANQLNLRNLGSTRTLILVDGYRVPATTYNGIVDVDIVPQMLVQRVDTVTGGVSAVYGSDAVTGVVNYILDKKFNGLKAQVNYGVSGQNDNKKYDIGIAGGMKLFDGRGHIEGSYEHLDQHGVLARSDRDWLNLYGVTGAGTAANPYVLQSNVRQATFPFGGLITNGPLTGQTFGAGGVLRPFVAGTATGTAALQIGGDGGYYDSSLIAPLKADQLFGRFDYDISDSVHAHVQVAGEKKTNRNYSDLVKLTNATFNAKNAYLSPAYQTAMGTTATFRLSELIPDTRLYAIADSNQWVYSGGLDGKIADYTWGVNLQHGQTKLKNELTNNVNNQALANALDAVLDSTGKVVCNITLVNGTACTPLNVFGAGSATPAALATVLTPTYYAAKSTMDDVSGHIEGSPFETWAGPVNLALSGEWRKIEFSSSSTAKPSDLVNCTGIRYNCTAGTGLWAFSFAASPKVSQTVKEIAVEANIPLLKDLAFAKSLSINGAARYTDYDTSGNYETWKIGADWQVNDYLRFRATKSRDIRAPTLAELFAPQNSVPVTPVDLLTGLSPTVPSTDLSNPNLTAELGNTLTGGFVLTPLSGLSIALDAYKITINDAIVQVTGSTPAYQQICYASGGSSALCALQTRPNGYTDKSAANAVTRWYTNYLNLAQVETKGADLEVNYNTQLLDRPANVRLIAGYQPHVYYRQLGVPTTDQGGVAFGPIGLGAGPAWRVAGFARFQPVKNLSVDILERWRSPMKLGGDPTQIWTNNHIGDFATTNVTFTYAMDTLLGATQFVFNVENLFDAHPPGGGYSGNGTRAGLRDGFALGDDVVGRAFTVGLRIRR